MTDPASFSTALDNATKVANTPLFTTVIDKLTGFKISQWSAEGEIRKKLIHDEYEKAKESGIMGMQYIENLRRTTNLIETAVKSSKYIDPEKPNNIKIDNDFFWNTIEHAKNISSEEIQELIAKIIAGEYNEPGTYSMCTLQTLKMLGKQELDLFQKICSLCIDKITIPKSIFASSNDANHVRSKLGVGFGSLQALQTLGLFLPNEMTQKIQNPEKDNYALIYLDKEIVYQPKHNSDFVITLPGYFALSDTGIQLLKHIKPIFVEEYYEWLKSNYKIQNYTMLES